VGGDCLNRTMAGRERNPQNGRAYPMHDNLKARAHRHFKAYWKARKFMRGHYKTFVAIGGIIISLTLAFKDKTQEQLRDLTNSIDSAEDFLRIADLTKSSNVRLNDLRTKIDTLQETVRPTHSYDPSGSRMAPVFDSIHDIADSLENVERLMDLVPNNQDLQTQVHGGHVIHDLLMNQADNVRDAIDARKRRSEKPKADEREQLIELASSMSALQYTIDALNTEVLEQLEAKKIVYQRRYILVSFVSYAFLAIGFSLSLSSHVVAKDGEIPDITF
jgi:uncharacterized protein YlxW (UPF0749 family)